jgi:hypothetical protein
MQGAYPGILLHLIIEQSNVGHDHGGATHVRRLRLIVLPAHVGLAPHLGQLLLAVPEQRQRYLQPRITWLWGDALRLIARDSELNRRFRLMLATLGIGQASALLILGKRAVMPTPWRRASGLSLADWSRKITFPGLLRKGTADQLRW